MTEPTTPDGVSIHTGFPNPAIDSNLRNLDLNQLLVQHGASTYFFRIEGPEWETIGIYDGDIAIIDRALDPRKTDTVIWWDENRESFAISTYKQASEQATIWGVVTATIHQLRKAAYDK